MDTEVVQRFLESVGQKADVDLYLKLFRAQRKESFAVIAAEPQIVRTALDPFHFDLRILASVGLTPVVLLGLLHARNADENAQRVYDWLIEDDVPARVIHAHAEFTEADMDAIRDCMSHQEIPLVSLQAARSASTEGRFTRLEKMVTALESRKVVFLSTSAGLEREGQPRISNVNLTTDYQHLLAQGQLSRRHSTLLRRVNDLLERVPHRLGVTVVNPLDLLRELFTVNGAGTLIRRGSRIDRHATLQGIDRARLETLIESAFARKLLPGVLDQPWACIFVEETYRGAAMLMGTTAGTYLSKFAVERTAQGEGIGSDVWNVMVREYPTFFWRARPGNPINPWYTRQCDGFVRGDDWHVFWRGLTPAEIPPAIGYARSLPAEMATA
jgi:hypothetical protein